jgi:magnesium chelatase family protein
MVARVKTFTFNGIEPAEVDVQVKISSGTVAFMLVGLPDKAVSESRERVRAAMGSIGLSLPARRITVNLAPADLQKEGSQFDLPIAIGILSAMNVVPEDAVSNYYALGELALDGTITQISGVLPAAMFANAAGMGIICPEECGSEAAWAGDGVDIIAPRNLMELINHLNGRQLLARPQRNIDSTPPQSVTNLKDVKGQTLAKRALEIAAAGGHNLLMVGPPGTGKSMLASSLPGILPPLDSEEILEVSVINSIAGSLSEGRLMTTRPYRDPHHSTSIPAMVGGGKNPKPGEISLSHNGVLFLDELPEFPRAVLESLRQPIETGKVNVARVNSHVTYPANFQLIAAMNPCRCGYLGDAPRECGKAPRCSSEYQAKISGPLLDRIDIHVEVSSLNTNEIFSVEDAESSEVVAKRVAKARNIQRSRFKESGIRTNTEMSAEHIKTFAELDLECMELMKKALEKNTISMRGYNRIIKVALTIADLAENSAISRPHLAEALSYRQLFF